MSLARKLGTKTASMRKASLSQNNQEVLGTGIGAGAGGYAGMRLGQHATQPAINNGYDMHELFGNMFDKDVGVPNRASSWLDGVSRNMGRPTTGYAKAPSFEPKSWLGSGVHSMFGAEDAARLQSGLGDISKMVRNPRAKGIGMLLGALGLGGAGALAGNYLSK
jgi:hypothetical protein